MNKVFRDSELIAGVKKKLIFDMEFNDLLEGVNKMHCFVGFDLISKKWDITTDPEEAARILTEDGVLAIGHNIMKYDLPALRKVSGLPVIVKHCHDTLPVAQYLDTTRKKHGLEGYGDDFGVPKPEISDWENLTPEEYLRRCTEDVKINANLYVRQINRLNTLYGGDSDAVEELLAYLTFKSDCIEEQYRNPPTVDFELLFKSMLELTEKREAVKSEVIEEMPNVIKFKTKTKPAKYHLKDGGLTKAAEAWEKLLQEAGYTPEQALEVESLEVVASEDLPNPDSHDQLKEWLFSLGWEPCTFKYVKEDKSDPRSKFRAVPQISDSDDKTKLTPSVLRLAEVNPAVAKLAGYSTLKHRVTILEGFLRDSIGGKLPAEANGLTNTLRLKHRTIVNLPKPKAAYAEHIRECLVAPEGYYMVGADLSGIEDNTKQHYIFPYDPEYVESMRTPGFDPHCRIAVLAELMNSGDEEFYKMYDNSTREEKESFSDVDHARFKSLKEKRDSAKTVNFSATYGVGAKTLARSGGFSETFAQKLIDTYWELNRAVKEFAEDREVKTINEQLWILQPVSGFWYPLRAQKDRFSTVNQSTAVYVFDLWVKFLREEGLQISMQYHDEVMFLVPNSVSYEETEAKVMRAMDKVNNILDLHIEVKCSLDFGQNYKQVH